MTPPTASPASSASSASPPPRSGRRRLLGLLLLAGTAVAAAGLGAWWILSPPSDPHRPTDLVDASPLLPPEPLPPLVPSLLSVEHARWTPQGWWVLDGHTYQIHRLGPDLEPVVSFGGRGQAPGEFLRARAMAFLGDTLVVLDDGGSPILHYLDLSGTLIRKTHVEVDGCSSFLGEDLVETPASPASLHMSGTCTRGLPLPAQGAAVVEVGPSGHAVLVAESMQTLRADGPSLPEVGVIVELGDELWTGNSAHPCFSTPSAPTDSPSSEGPGPFCPSEWTGVRFSVEDIRASIGDRPGGERMVQLFSRVEYLHFMDGAFPHDEGIVVRRMSGLRSRELSLLRADGSMSPLRSGLPESSWYGGGEILVAWSGVEGVHLERTPLASLASR